MPDKKPRRTIVLPDKALEDFAGVARLTSKLSEAKTPVALKAINPEEYAVISDIHGNYPAYKAILEEIALKGIPYENICNLGDILDYGGNVLEVIKEAQKHPYGKMCSGNHELAVLLVMGIIRLKDKREKEKREREARGEKREESGIMPDPYGFLREKGISEIAARCMIKTGEMILRSPDVLDYLKFLKGLPRQIRISETAKGIHGFREQLTQDIVMRYVIPQEIAAEYGILEQSLVSDPAKVIHQSGLFDDGLTKVIIFGHSHASFAVAMKKNGDFKRLYIPNEKPQNGLIGTFEVNPEEYTLVSVGGGSLTKRERLGNIKEVLNSARNRGYNSLAPSEYITFKKDCRLIKFYELYHDYNQAEKAAKALGMPDTFRTEVEG